MAETDVKTEDEAPTLDQLGTVGEVEELLQSLVSGGRAVPGQVFMETEGFTARHRRNRSMVRLGDRELPERVKVWDRYGRPSLVPTVAIHYHLNKKDRNGNRVFFARLPEGIEEPVPIDETCEICLPKGIHKRFFNEYDLDGHYEYYHPREWRIIQRKRDREEGLDPRAIVAAIAMMSTKQQKQMRMLLSEEEPKRRGKNANKRAS